MIVIIAFNSNYSVTRITTQRLLVLGTLNSKCEIDVSIPVFLLLELPLL